MKLKLILTIIALRFSAKCEKKKKKKKKKKKTNKQKKKTLALYVPRRRRRRPVFPYKADACTESCVVTTPATNRRETSVLIRSDIRTFPIKTRRKSPISTIIADQK